MKNVCRAAGLRMSRVTVRLVGIAEEWFTLDLPSDTTIWQLQTNIRALRGIPRKLQRMLVGERLAAAGDTLASFAVDPVTVTVVQSEPSCAHCGTRNLTLRRCSSCNNVYYCGQLCQSFDWRRHQLTCRSYAAGVLNDSG